MPLDPETLMIVIIALVIFTGLLMVRSARQHRPSKASLPEAQTSKTPPRASDRICPEKTCRHRNPAQALYCGHCGRALKDE